MHGATGWLYGQSEPGIPTLNIMAPLKPGISAQKPEGGLQHPGGDALTLMPYYKKAGGHLMQIYMQDIYPDWPYNDLGQADYLEKAKSIARQVVADPNREWFVYVPFNEPNNNWYGYNDAKLTHFLGDWKAVYEAIRSIDRTAKIAGPGYENYNTATYEAFFTFARDNHVLPDETTWHELHDDFFTGWYKTYDDYRMLEKNLGISPLPVVINEYVRERGDLGVPGNLVQWMTRLENRKVDGCLAYWTPSGTLSELTALTWPNRATGAWWVYYWYAQMTGETVKVRPPDLNAEGLQGIASKDEARKQIRILFGGSAAGVDVQLEGLGKLPWAQKGMHMAMWRVDGSGTAASSGPHFIEEADVALKSGHVTLSIEATDASAAYYAVLTPAGKTSPQSSVRGSRAVYATLSGKARTEYSHETGGVTGLDAGEVEIPLTANQDGYYTLSVHYRAISSSEILKLRLNGSLIEKLDLPRSEAGSGVQEAKATLFLAGGINRFGFSATSGDLELVSAEVSAANGLISTYKAEESTNTIERGVVNKNAANGLVGFPSLGGAGMLRFNDIHASATGHYKLAISYSNDEKGHGGPVDELASVQVNGHVSKEVYFRNTVDAKTIRTLVMDVDLVAGENVISIVVPSERQGPNIEKIAIARAVERR